ncbi:hypothetical protein A2V68_00560 [candidate division Kazan bacterium RBG_13_50_9]|uniref:Peptidase C39 domain-containing protein n=1 Tax=candidate division Kazan bacterium RBG_13_50_9 TaxID=1798535 RepID=A0A1F4NSA1_UNCK3|nr:MAG: hypothetical protein A2V68_00560 [candidate division Kazan bacterium RBG_13_50_9]
MVERVSQSAPEAGGERTAAQELGEHNEQSGEKTCVAAALAILREFALGYPEIQSDRDIVHEAKEAGVQTEKGVTLKAAYEFYKQLGHTVTIRKNLEDILRELGSDKGLVVIADKHAVAVYLDKERGKLVRRDPIARNAVTVHEVDIDTLRDLLGVAKPTGKKNGENPYDHVLIVGKVGSKLVTGETGEVDLVAKARMEMEARFAEKRKMAPEERLAWIWKTYRPKMEIPKAQTKFKLFGREVIWDEKTTKKFERFYNRRLEAAYRWELGEVQKKIEGLTPEAAHRYLDGIESRYLAEANVISEQIKLVTKDDPEHIEHLDQDIKRWKRVKEHCAYTDRERAVAERTIRELEKERQQIKEGGPKKAAAAKARGLAQKPSPWAELRELRAEYYAVSPAEMAEMVEIEKDLIIARERYLQKELLRNADLLRRHLARKTPAVKEFEQLRLGYQKLLPELAQISKDFDIQQSLDKARRFVELQARQSNLFFEIFGQLTYLKTLDSGAQSQAAA